MHQFTVGIPTYNRSGFLRDALASACTQLDGQVSVVVVDNGSTDATAEVLANHPPNTTVIRYPQNSGAHFSFSQTLEHAGTEFFSWLQDDDLLHSNFLARAKAAFAVHPEASVYMAYAACTSSRTNIDDARLYGAPVSVRSFLGGDMQLVESSALIALSFFCSVGIPPVVVFRTKSLRMAMTSWNPSFPLYAERSVLNSVLRTGPAIVDAYVGGVFYQHAGQEYKRLFKLEEARRSDWLDMARQVQVHLASYPGWMTSVVNVLTELPPSTARAWLKGVADLGDGIEECREICKFLQQKLDDGGCHPEGRGGTASPSGSFAKGCARQFVPPILWELAASAKRYAKGIRS